MRRGLPLGGRLHIDRQLPFLIVYRQPPDRPDFGTDRLVVGEAAYLIASGTRRLRPSLLQLVSGVVETQRKAFGAFLVIEIWAAPDQQQEPGDTLPPRPGFRIVTDRAGTLPGITESLRAHLSSIRIRKRTAEVEVAAGAKLAPVGLPPLLVTANVRRLGCHVLGLEVRPVYRDPQTGEGFPLIRRAMLRQLGRALKQTFYQFARTQTTQRPSHYHVLGRRAVVRAVWEVDRKLSDISSVYDFLLQVTPVNVTQAWARFRRGHFEKSPTFYYRPQEYDPSLLRRRLWDIRIERLEDPTLGELFREKRAEIDTQLSMLASIDTKGFLYGSLQLSGAVDDALLETAKSLLVRVPPRSRDSHAQGYLDAAAFAARAEAEIEYYRQTYPQLPAKVEIRSDTTGLMVSRGNLLVSHSTRLPSSRVEALIQHEVGTHILTYHNGRAQPFRQLYSGLSGYEELQEGMAVFAEYLVGGLSRPRLRLLAARVIAARALTEGAAFVETFRQLDDDWGFEQRTAFGITMRVYRGGGLTKDMVYLKGLVRLLAYLGKGGDLEPLYVGKIGIDHIPVIRELQLRQVLHPAPLRPRFLHMDDTPARLQKARKGLVVADLIELRN